MCLSRGNDNVLMFPDKVLKCVYMSRQCPDMCLNISILDNTLMCLDTPRQCLNVYVHFLWCAQKSKK